MSWLGFSALGAAFLFFLVVPLVLLYFLKLKRPRIQIPSLVLWRQVLNDNRVNSPFQRFKRNLLLLLQLLLLCLLILAAMLPYWRTDASDATRLPILIDRSASMSAFDEKGGISRLESAKRAVREMINDLGGVQELALIAFGRTARQMAPFTSNKRVLNEALDQIEVEHVGSDLTEALRMADAMARTSPFERVLLFSDGNFDPKVDFDLPFKLDYERLKAAGPNLGIAAVSARRASNDAWTVFVHVQGTEDAAIAPTTLELIQDGETRGDDPVVIHPGRGQRLMFTIRADKQTSIELLLKPTGFDSMACDNRAFMELAPIRPIRVYVPPALVSYRHALAVNKQIQMWPAEGQTDAPGLYDLAILDTEAPDVTAATTLHVGIVPQELRKFISVSTDGTTVVDWRRESPLLEHVELGDLMIMDEPAFVEGVEERDLENLHYEVLAHGQRGPLVLQKEEGQTKSFYLLFHTDRSTLPYRVGFPILASNALRIAMLQAGVLQVPGERTEALPPVSAVANATYRIDGPGGYERDETADATGVLAGVPAPHVGRYEISGEGLKDKQVGVSLLRSHETLLASVETIDLNETSVEAAATTGRMNKRLWPTLAALALAMLLLEWWWFQRRPGGQVK